MKITRRNGITRSKLRRLGYRKGATCYFKRRSCRRGTTTVMVQVQPFQGLHSWKRGEPSACYVNSREYPVRDKGSPIEFTGPEQSQAMTMRELRDWESFAFVP